MGNIERWTLHACALCGTFVPIVHDNGGICCGRPTEAIEVVRASTAEGAVEDRARYKAALDAIITAGEDYWQTEVAKAALGITTPGGNIKRWDIQVFGVDPETRAGLGELQFSVIDHGRSATVYVDLPSAEQLREVVSDVDVRWDIEWLLRYAAQARGEPIAETRAAMLTRPGRRGQ